ncbi:MAG: undecaprenyl/decaprenyl-phosphate alpha-N-acetylglucosaminyl 1-phosphate transferase [Bradymonadales bacterium]|nr:MAG: undecaprenyl/decaprenyl-phosphate alpha-N-acetylglucosaminyl 1-phosphate transferase [Bradymonadales bacterium]
MSEVFGFFVLLTFLACVFAWASSSVLLPFCIRHARRWGSLDRPNPRKLHQMPTPRLGGLGISPTIWFACAMALFAVDRVGPRLDLPAYWNPMLVGLLLGSGGMFLIGLLDDLKSMSASRKLLGQALVAAVVIAFLPIPQSIMGIELPQSLSLFLIFGWLLVVPNAINLMDGIDGLTSGMLLVFLLTASVLAVAGQQSLLLMISLPLAVTIISFLRFNWAPAKIFLGDSGSLSLGFVVAYLSLGVSFQSNSPGGHPQNWSLWISLLLVSVWLADTSIAVARRYLSKAPRLKIFLKRSKITYFLLHQAAIRNIVRPDCRHLHHLALRSGFSVKSTVFLISASLLSIHFSLLGFWLFAQSETKNFVAANLLPSLLICSSAVIFLQIVDQVRKKRSLEPSKEIPGIGASGPERKEVA